MTNPVPELLRLLGEPVVFIDWPHGVKGTKRKWGHLTPADMTPDYLAKLQHGNIGVALGAVSGGLCAIDIDDGLCVEPFLNLNPHLRNALQTHGARGRVFWIRFTGAYPTVSSKLKSKSGEIGEFRSNGNQSIVWGIHPDTQKPYTFVVEQPAAQADFVSIKWPETIVNPPALQRDRSHLCDSVSPSLCNSASLSSPSLCLSVKSIEQAVELCIPEKEHQNNAALFKLVRATLALNATNQERIRAFELWHNAASTRGVLRPSQSKDEYLMEFMNGCRKAKTPLGSSPAETAWKLAEMEPPPPEAKMFTSKEGKLLVALCWQMHNLAKGEPWFLATRTAAKLTGKTHTTVATWLSALVQMGILAVVEPATTTRATRYRYKEGAKV